MIEDETPEPELLRIESISVEGLFGLYDHTIPLNLEDRVTIIHGPNGVGKTKILEWTASLLRLGLSEFFGVPFLRFTVGFTNGASLSVEPVEPREDAALRLCYQAPGSPLSVLEIARQARADETADLLRRVLPRPQDPWARMLDRVDVHFVRAQRLLRPREDEDDDGMRSDINSVLIPTVGDCSRDLHRRIRESLAEYANTAQSLDQSFPQRLIQFRASAFDVEALKQRMTTLEATREELGRLGLLGNEDPGHSFDVSALDEIEPERRLVLSVYVEDSEAKLRTLEDFARRIRVFLDNINGKFSNKRLYVDPKIGLVAENDSGRKLALAALSSGEQHEIVLLYDLLFNVRPNTLVLIDEPELSLHITWQKRFLDDLLQIAKLVGIDALVATHSPFIIGEREDLMVALEATPSTRAAPA